MSEFHELIKNFERIRNYMRQFYIYGFKVRGDYDRKSSRTYDNERRRIESWLADYIETDYTKKGKQIAISVDSSDIPQNPLYKAWKSKSFTNNDILLHFFILDLLMDGEEHTANSACDRIAEQYGVIFDSQTLRLKLKEYETLGILSSYKDGRELYYGLVPDVLSADSRLYDALLTAVKFFQETAPMGFIGSTLLDREFEANELFRFKHHFIVHTLDDQVLLDVLNAIKAKQKISFSNIGTRSGRGSMMYGIPLKIFVSTRTGRRYVCIYQERSRRFTNMRLDAMSKIKALKKYEDYDTLQEALKRNLPNCWGVSFGGNARLEEIHLTLHINEESEPYILERLHREGRGGQVLRIRENTFLYYGTFFDINEMLGFIRTFTGRILNIESSNTEIIAKINNDFKRMYAMYCCETKQEEENGII